MQVPEFDPTAHFERLVAEADRGRPGLVLQPRSTCHAHAPARDRSRQEDGLALADFDVLVQLAAPEVRCG